MCRHLAMPLVRESDVLCRQNPPHYCESWKLAIAASQSELAIHLNKFNYCLSCPTTFFVIMFSPAI
jgi:hypothetical protein